MEGGGGEQDNRQTDRQTNRHTDITTLTLNQSRGWLSENAKKSANILNMHFMELFVIVNSPTPFPSLIVTFMLESKRDAGNAVLNT